MQYVLDTPKYCRKLYWSVFNQAEDPLFLLLPNFCGKSHRTSYPRAHCLKITKNVAFKISQQKYYVFLILFYLGADWTLMPQNCHLLLNTNAPNKKRERAKVFLNETFCRIFNHCECVTLDWGMKTKGMLFLWSIKSPMGGHN